MQVVRHRWRDYRTVKGARPVKDFINALSDRDTAEILEAMREVTNEGLRAARHLRGRIYEIRADGDDVSYRVLFAPEGKKGRILLSLLAFPKQTQKTPAGMIQLAERRLADWRRRARD